MARIALYKDNYADSTVVSNLFIDEYMKDANDAQLKVYFYLLRMLNAEQAISVSRISEDLSLSAPLAFSSGSCPLPERHRRYIFYD